MQQPPPVIPPYLPSCPLCHQALIACTCGTTPAQSAPAPPQSTIAKTPARIVERYGVVYCRDCDFVVAYCACARSPDAQSNDGAESLLQRRIAEYQGGR